MDVVPAADAAQSSRPSPAPAADAPSDAPQKPGVSGGRSRGHSGGHSGVDALITQRIEDHRRNVEALDASHRATIAEAATLVLETLLGDGAVYVCGNGGSAADAQHIATELVCRFLIERRALRCHALTTNTSSLTAEGNDHGFETSFSRQVEAFVRPGDLLWVLSTSGSSPNVLAAAETARQRGVRVLGFTGSAGGSLRERCDVCFLAPCETTYGIQQLHQLAYHIICEQVEAAIA